MPCGDTARFGALLAFQLVGGSLQPGALEGLDVTGVGEGGQGGVNGHFRQNAEALWRKVQVFWAVLPEILAPEQSQ